jgi:putative DNA methylase
VRVSRRDELPEDWDPSADPRLTVWELAQHLIRTLEEEGELAAADLLARARVKSGGIGEASRGLAYRLYRICEVKGWAAEARAYNGLVVAWPRIAARPTSAAAPEPQTRLPGV